MSNSSTHYFKMATKVMWVLVTTFILSACNPEDSTKRSIVDNENLRFDSNFKSLPSEQYSEPLADPTPESWGTPNEPAGFVPIVERSFNTKANSDGDRGVGSFPNKTGGSEGWDGYEAREPNLTIVDAPLDPLSPGSAMRFTYPVGLAAGNGPGVAQTVGLGSPRKLYVRTSIRLGPSYYTDGVSNKLYFHRMNGEKRGEPFLALFSNGDATFQLAVNFQGTPDNVFGWYFADGAARSLSKETWYVIETLLTPNSSEGTPDGTFQVFLNGDLVFERNDVEYITVSNRDTFSAFHVSPTFGGSNGGANDTEFYWDLGHVYVSGSP